MSVEPCGTTDICPGPVPVSGPPLNCKCLPGYLNVADSCCLSQGWIIGLAVGSAALLVMIMIGIFAWFLHFDRQRREESYRKSQRRKSSTYTASTFDNPSMYRKSNNVSTNPNPQPNSGLPDVARSTSAVSTGSEFQASLHNVDVSQDYSIKRPSLQPGIWSSSNKY